MQEKPSVLRFYLHQQETSVQMLLMSYSRKDDIVNQTIGLLVRGGQNNLSIDHILDCNNYSFSNNSIFVERAFCKFNYKGNFLLFRMW